MMFPKKYIILLVLLFKINISFCQDLTGTWEGDLGNSEFLQINIVQVDDVLCGYTWDYVYNDRRSFCKAYFTSRHDKNNGQWILIGTSFFANSGDHILMRLTLKSKTSNGEDILEGYETDPSVGSGLFALISRQKIFVRRVSKTPRRMMPNMQDCNKAKQPQKNPLKIKPDPKKFVGPVQPAPDSIKKVIVPVKPIEKDRLDSLKKIKAPVAPVINMSDSSILAKKMNTRTNKEMKHIIVNEKDIVLNVYDNGIVDNDTVSVFYNGKLLLSHKKLSEKPIVIPISLDEKTTIHEITLFAENLGSIPPNTALIVVTAGDKRYELYASSSLTENAVIVFEYKPK